MGAQRPSEFLRASPRWVRPIAQCLGLVALAYVVLAMYQQWPVLSSWRPRATQIVVVCGLIAIYGGSLFLLAENWHRCVRVLGRVNTPRGTTYASFVLTQVGKYVPGNVVHFVGRHLWLMQTGIAHRALYLAFVLETFILVAASVAVGMIATWAFPPELQGLIYVIRMVAPAASSLIVVSVIGLLVVAAARIDVGKTISQALVGFGSAVLFFLVQGMVFFCICSEVSSGADLSAVGVAVVAWTAGFVVPGAPGGIGIREFIIFVLLGPTMPQAELLIAITLFRIITTAGDVSCYLVGRALFSAESARPGGRGS